MALYLTRAVAVPVLLAVIVGTILAALVDRLRRHRIPRVVSTVFIAVLLLALLVVFVVASLRRCRGGITAAGPYRHAYH